MLCRYQNGVLVMPKALVSSPISAYENSVEVESVAALEEIISDPDSMRMQALLVRERILGPAHPDTSYYIRYRSYSTPGYYLPTSDTGHTVLYNVHQTSYYSRYQLCGAEAG